MHDLPSWAEPIIQAALEAVDPRRAVARHLRLEAGSVWVDDASYAMEGRLCVLAIGKAAAGMFAGARDVLGDRIARSLVVTKHGAADGADDVLVGDHPVPGVRSAEAGRRVCAFIEELTPSDLLLVLLSGGGSALVAAPIDGVTIEDLARVTSALLRAGASIGEINTVRRHLDVLKGGGLAARCRANVVTLLISDVIGGGLEAVASGPTAPDPSSPSDAAAILRARGLEDTRIEDALRGAEPKRAVLVPHVVVGDCASAVAAAEEAALRLGYHLVPWGATVEGEARDVGRMLASDLRDYDGPRPACFIGGGETTVTVAGNGMGGRNQEVVLGAVEALHQTTGRAFAAFATDGEDGPTDAGGAWADGETLVRSERLDLDLRRALDHNDAYHFFGPLGALLRPGPTGTNVNDLYVGIVVNA